MFCMKTFYLALTLTLVAGCAGLAPVKGAEERDPVLIIYHVRPGSESELQNLLKRAWQTYLSEGLVCSKPHLVMRVREDEQNFRIIEGFCWVGPFATEYPPDQVKQVWRLIEPLCESRQGNASIEVRQAEILSP